MKQKFETTFKRIDVERVLKRTGELLALELGQTFHCYEAAARRAYEILGEEGIPNAELLSFPADGKTVYQDKRMPLAWDATVGKLTVLSGSGIEPGWVAADFQAHPFHLVKGSTAVPGRVARVITEAQFLAGEDVRGNLVMLNAGTWPRAAVLTPILDAGGLVVRS